MISTKTLNRMTLHITALMVLTMCTSCAYFGHKKDVSETDSTDATETIPAADVNHEAELRSIVTKYLEKTSESDGSKGKLRGNKPYFFREYAQYPDGSESFNLVVQEKESRTTPLVADVKLNKIRYTTELRRKKEIARRDTDFTRETGVETSTWELRQGKWRRVGSLFIVEKREQQVNNEWVEAYKPVETSVEPDRQENKSWFRRIWPFGSKE